MSALREAIRQTLERRESLARELAALDTEIAESRALLGGELDLASACTLVPPAPEGDATSSEAAPVTAQTAGAVSTQGPTVAPLSSPKRVESEVRTCERCGASFHPSRTSSGRFCSRECYNLTGVREDAARVADDDIVRVVTERGSSRPADLSALLGMDGRILRERLKGLAEQGKVRILGSTNARRVYPGTVVTPAAETKADRAFSKAVRAAKELATTRGHKLLETAVVGGRWSTVCRACRCEVAVVGDDAGTVSVVHAPERCAPTSVLPRRRCGRCMKEFSPAGDREYVCQACVGKRQRHQGEEPGQLETAWTPGKDAPSLTGGAAGLGSTLAGGEFMVRR